jgi:transcriptional regulator with XRE-family HTH domain
MKSPVRYSNVDLVDEDKSTIRSRELGDALRMAMERANINGKRMAELLEWSQSHVSRLLTGRIIATDVEVAAFLAICRVTGEAKERLMRLTEELNTPGWVQQFGSRLPTQLKTLVDHESRAAEISDFEPDKIPGLLQTGDYAKALLERSATVPADEVQDRVAARLGRKSLFSRDHRPQCTFYVHEAALYTVVGSPQIMSEQLHELLRLGVRTYLSVRVIPFSFGAHAGNAGSCRLMEFTELKPVVYVETQTAGIFLEKPEEIQAYRSIFAALADSALDEGQSRDLIAVLAVDRHGFREDHDDRA